MSSFHHTHTRKCLVESIGEYETLGNKRVLKSEGPLTKKEKIDKYKFDFIKIKFSYRYLLGNGKDDISYLQDTQLT